MRKYISKDVKLPARACLAQLIDAQEAGDEKARSTRSVSIFTRGESEAGKAVSLDRAVLRMREGLRGRNTPGMLPPRESNIITGFFRDLAYSVAGVYF